MNDFFALDKDFITRWLSLYDNLVMSELGMNNIFLGVKYPKSQVEVEEVEMRLP